MQALKDMIAGLPGFKPMVARMLHLSKHILQTDHSFENVASSLGFARPNLGCPGHRGGSCACSLSCASAYNNLICPHLTLFPAEVPGFTRSFLSEEGDAETDREAALFGFMSFGFNSGSFAEVSG